MVMTRIGGRDYPMRTSGTCHTCQSPHRLFIENALIEGYSYTNIAIEVAGRTRGVMPHPSKTSISEHVRKDHMPLQAATQRRLMERRALEVGQSLEDGVDAMVDLVVVNQMVMAKGYERMQRGEIQPDVADMLAASKMLHLIEQSAGGGIDEQMWRDALMVYLEIAQQFIPQDSWQAYGQAISAHPVIKSILAAQQAATDESSVA